MKLDKRFVWLVTIVISLLVTSYARGIGLEVDPGEINIKNIPLGKTIVVSEWGPKGSKLKIRNKSAASFIYSINILASSKTSASLKTGYVDIPDTSWIWPEEKEILIPGNSIKEAELFLKIPLQKKYSNKNFQAVIEVKSKKNRPDEIFVLACQLKLLFSTENFAEERPHPQKRIHRRQLQKLNYSTKQERGLSQCPESLQGELVREQI